MFTHNYWFCKLLLPPQTWSKLLLTEVNYCKITAKITATKNIRRAKNKKTAFRGEDRKPSSPEKAVFLFYFFARRLQFF